MGLEMWVGLGWRGRRRFRSGVCDLDGLLLKAVEKLLSLI